MFADQLLSAVACNDAELAITVSVTQADIDDAREQGWPCPVTRAARRAYPGHDCSVGSRSIRVGPRIAYLPDAVGTRIRLWDRHHAMAPFTFSVPCHHSEAHQCRPVSLASFDLLPG
jgi:hypothetical protein